LYFLFNNFVFFPRNSLFNSSSRSRDQYNKACLITLYHCFLLLIFLLFFYRNNPVCSSSQINDSSSSSQQNRSSSTPLLDQVEEDDEEEKDDDDSLPRGYSRYPPTKFEGVEPIEPLIMDGETREDMIRVWGHGNNCSNIYTPWKAAWAVKRIVS
jgi:hypothetical protein